MGPVLDEVVGPDMVGPARLRPDAGAVIEPETAPLGLLPGDLQPLPPPALRAIPPGSLDPLSIDRPALGPGVQVRGHVGVQGTAKEGLEGRATLFPRELELCHAHLGEGVVRP